MRRAAGLPETQSWLCVFLFVFAIILEYSSFMRTARHFLIISFLLLLSANFALAVEAAEKPLSYQEFTGKISHDISLEIKSAKYALSQDTMEKWGTEETILVYNPNYRSEMENPDLCRHREYVICRLIFDVRKEYRIQKVSEIKFDEKSIRSFLDDLERQANKDPENAKFKAENGKVVAFALSAKGIKLDKEKSFAVLVDHLKNRPDETSVKLSYDETEPEISSDSIDNLGITTLIGEGRSNFKGSPKNRIFNINVGAKRFDGVLIKPGEEFSFVKILGPVDGEHGYLPELVIKQNKTEPEFGGGICQVSTTAFRAAVRSGLKITARKNHAYPVQYYNPQGMDATVYVPRPDLRFLNNTPGYILIQTKIEGTELVFQFYGTDDGRKTNIIGPVITERNSDGSMKATFTQQVFNKDGDTLIEDVFNSAYASPSKYPHPGQVLTEKPKDWSKKQWEEYKKKNNL
jgi:vancomycin resistance protein YoaR